MKKVLSQEGYKIKTIFGQEESQFEKPFIKYDIMKPREVKAEIQTYTAEEVGNFHNKIEQEVYVTLWKVPLDKKKTWAPRQRHRYYLRKSDLPEDANSEKALRLPRNHVLQVDKANRKMRLIGPYISPIKKETEWIYY